MEKNLAEDSPARTPTNEQPPYNCISGDAVRESRENCGSKSRESQELLILISYLVTEWGRRVGDAHLRGETPPREAAGKIKRMLTDIARQEGTWALNASTTVRERAEAILEGLESP